MRHMYVVYVNGYGIPEQRSDENYRRYMMTVATYLQELLDYHVRPLVIFGGGATNPNCPSMTEAGYMSELLRVDYGGIYPKCDIWQVHGESAHDNLLAMRRIIWEEGTSVVTCFCEWARQDYFRHLTHRYIPSALIRPILFDRGYSPRWSVRLMSIMRLPFRLREHVASAPEIKITHAVNPTSS